MEREDNTRFGIFIQVVSGNRCHNVFRLYYCGKFVNEPSKTVDGAGPKLVHTSGVLYKKQTN